MPASAAMDSRLRWPATRGEIIALGADGKELWRTQVGGEMRSPPLVGRGLVVVRSTDYRVTALDAASGRRRWAYQRANVPLTLRSLTEMVYAGDFVIAGFPSGRLVALNAANGAVRWDVAVSEPRGATEVERLADVVGAPLVIGNEVCAASYQGRVGCFDATNGSLRWSSEISAARVQRPTSGAFMSSTRSRMSSRSIARPDRRHGGKTS